MKRVISTLDDIADNKKKKDGKIEETAKKDTAKRGKTKDEKEARSTNRAQKEKKADEISVPDDISEEVLRPHEVLRDPIYGDIWITLLERAIIDTPLFQRLRGKRQLGPTHLVYHGATHTRFEHSIGVLHMAESIVRICNENCEKYANPYLMEVDPYNHLLIRLYALLHDTAHIPFGHTLEREGNLFSSHEWADQKRADKILGSKSEMRKAIKETLELYGLSDKQVEKIVGDLTHLLTYDHDEDPMDFKCPFVIDIVGNTLCADLLDYSVRDMYYCGLTERWGDRFLQYLAVLPLVKVDSKSEEFDVKPVKNGGKGRLVLLSYRYERDRSNPRLTRAVRKRDVISEAVDLLRKRYSLAEKVYFHRTKKAASAMLISAVAEEELSPEELLEMTCDQVVAKLAESSNARANSIAQNYLKRNLYKVIYEIRYKKPSEEDSDARELWDEIAPAFRKPRVRTEKEREIEREMDLKPGSLIIYCPQPGMNVKQIEMLVQTKPENQVKPLRLILDETRKEELAIIDEYFNRLWSLQVLVNPEEVDPQEINNPDVRCLSGLCEEIFGLPNELNEALRGTKRDLMEARIHVAAGDWDEKNPNARTPYFIVEQLKAESHRYTANQDAIKKQLEKMVKEHYEKQEALKKQPEKTAKEHNEKD